MANQRRLLKIAGGQTGKYLYQGIFGFTTTGLTKDVDIPLSRVESVFVKPVGAPGTTYRTITQRLGAVTATTSFPILTPPYAGTLVAAKITVDTTHATHDDNHWTFTLVNKGAAGSGTTDMILASAANSTDATGGAAITAFVARSLTLHGTAANLATAASDVLSLVATKAASAVSLAGAVIELTFAMLDVGEQLTVDESVTGTVGTDGVRISGGSNGSTTVTVKRNGINPTSGLSFSLLALGSK